MRIRVFQPRDVHAELFGQEDAIVRVIDTDAPSEQVVPREPPVLAVTKDGDKRPGVPLHYTIAPKDDMPFTLFLQHLKGLEAKLKKHNAG